MALTEQMRANFLRRLGVTYASAYPRRLEESFPHIMEKIIGLWGTQGMLPYFETLLVTRRPDRVGFPPEIASELLRLHSLHHKLGLTQPAPQQVGDVWNWVDKVGYFEKETVAAITPPPPP
jgi:hypothetical protein